MAAPGAQAGGKLGEDCVLVGSVDVPELGVRDDGESRVAPLQLVAKNRKAFVTAVQVIPELGDDHPVEIAEAWRKRARADLLAERPDDLVASLVPHTIANGLDHAHRYSGPVYSRMCSPQFLSVT
jgi:hypothetical protein